MWTLALLLLAAEGDALVTIESDLPGTLAKVDALPASFALPVTIKLAPGAHEVVLENASLPPLKAKLNVIPTHAQRVILSIEDPEHAPILRLLHASADDDVAIDGRFLMTPLQEQHTITAGPHEVVIKKRSGGSERRMRLLFERGQTAVI